MNTTQVTQGFLLYFLLPLWMVAGLADWICHRVSHIEETSGTHEALIHVLMMTEVGTALWPGLLLQINSAIIALMLTAYVAHEATAIWDVRYANAHRRLAPIEQSIHSFLDMIPLMAVSFVIILHWQAFLGLFGLGNSPADFSIRWKTGTVPSAEYLGIFVIASVFMTELPYLEELTRCIRAARARTPRASATRDAFSTFSATRPEHQQ